MNLFELLFGFKGRINRARYWLAVAIWLALWVVVTMVLIAFGLEEIAIAVALLVAIPSVLSAIAIGIKRLHDRDRSGWWLLVFYVLPGVLDGVGEATGTRLILGLASVALSIWGFVELGILRGTPGPNRYGDDPLAYR